MQNKLLVAFSILSCCFLLRSFILGTLYFFIFFSEEYLTRIIKKEYSRSSTNSITITKTCLYAIRFSIFCCQGCNLEGSHSVLYICSLRVILDKNCILFFFVFLFYIYFFYCCFFFFLFFFLLSCLIKSKIRNSTSFICSFIYLNF